MIIQNELNDIKDIKSITAEFLDIIFDIKTTLKKGKYISSIIFFIIIDINKNNEGNKFGDNEYNNSNNINNEIVNDSNEFESDIEQEEFEDKKGDTKNEYEKNRHNDDEVKELYNVDFA